MNQKYSDFGIGEVVEKTGVTHKQLRYWEEKGYIPAPERIVCGDRAYRRYTNEHIKLLGMIKRFIDQGFRLEGAVRMAQRELKTGGDDNGDK